MAYNEISKFQLLAALIKEDRYYQEFDDAKPYGDVLIEILRRLHHWNDDKWDATTVIDVVFETIAEDFRYAIGEWDEVGNDVDASEEKPRHTNVLDAIEDTIKVARQEADPSLPPELDIPNQH